MRHDAQLQIQSEDGKGSKFTIQFPRSAMLLRQG
jgi:signal transduction histidine kinase